MEGFLETAVPLISGLAEIIGLFIIVTSLVKATYHYVRATFFHAILDFLPFFRIPLRYMSGVAEELREQHSPVYVCALCPGPVDTEFNDRADVVFALKGITPELCVEEAMRGMLRRKTIIVPSTLMRLATTAQKLVPTPLLMPILAHQQKKKLG